MGKKILIGLIIVLVVIQFIPANLPEVKTDNPDDLLANYDVPEDIGNLLRASCYDCHSNETVYPWYSHVAPVSFLVSRDTREGREHLNFSEWKSWGKLDQLEALDEISEEVEEGEMPMKIYPIMHPDARLSDEDRERIVEWAEAFGEQILEED